MPWVIRTSSASLCPKAGHTQLPPRCCLRPFIEEELFVDHLLPVGVGLWPPTELSFQLKRQDSTFETFNNDAKAATSESEITAAIGSESREINGGRRGQARRSSRYQTGGRGAGVGVGGKLCRDQKQRRGHPWRGSQNEPR